MVQLLVCNSQTVYDHRDRVSASQLIRSNEKDSGLQAGSLSVRSTWPSIPGSAVTNAQTVEGKSCEILFIIGTTWGTSNVDDKRYTRHKAVSRHVGHELEHVG
jgi:hypothetical protein